MQTLNAVYIGGTHDGDHFSVDRSVYDLNPVLKVAIAPVVAPNSQAPRMPTEHYVRRTFQGCSVAAYVINDGEWTDDRVKERLAQMGLLSAVEVLQSGRKLLA